MRSNPNFRRGNSLPRVGGPCRVRAKKVKRRQLSFEERQVVHEAVYATIDQPHLKKPLHEMKTDDLKFMQKRLTDNLAKQTLLYSESRKAIIESILKRIEAILKKRKQDQQSQDEKRGR